MRTLPYHSDEIRRGTRRCHKMIRARREQPSTSTHAHARRAYAFAAVLLHTAERSTTLFSERSSRALRTRSTSPGGCLSGQCTWSSERRPNVHQEKTSSSRILANPPFESPLLHRARLFRRQHFSHGERHNTSRHGLRTPALATAPDGRCLSMHPALAPEVTPTKETPIVSIPVARIKRSGLSPHGFGI